jgi:hypothetical protein
MLGEQQSVMTQTLSRMSLAPMAEDDEGAGVYAPRPLTNEDDSADDLRARALQTLAIAVRAARPAWTVDAVQSFAERVEEEAYRGAASRLQYERVLEEKIARLRRVALEDPMASSPLLAPSGRRFSFSAPAPPPPMRSRRESIQACVDALGHACQCVAAECTEPSCRKVQDIIRHSAQCDIAPPHCEVCRQLAILCRFHASACTDTSGHCPVPRCAHTKDELREPMAL